jgi:hypothetical protein
MFNPETFLSAQVADANSTSSAPVPANEYTAVVDKIDVRQWTKKDDPSVSGLTLEVFWSIDDPSGAVKDATGRDKNTVKQGIMLDLAADGQNLDVGKGRNVGLGKLREAVNMNQPGVPFSFTQLVGQAARVSVTHRAADDAIYAEIKKVARL